MGGVSYQFILKDFYEKWVISHQVLVNHICKSCIGNPRIKLLLENVVRHTLKKKGSFPEQGLLLRPGRHYLSPKLRPDNLDIHGAFMNRTHRNHPDIF